MRVENIRWSNNKLSEENAKYVKYCEDNKILYYFYSNELKHKYKLRTKINKTYYYTSFKSIYECINYTTFINDELKSECHEIFTKDKPVKVFLDIDIKNPKQTDIDYISDIVNEYVEALKSVLNTYYNKEIEKLNFLYTQRVRPDKIGIHIITNYYVDNIREINEIVELMKEEIKDNILKESIDGAPYYYNKSLALPNGYKDGYKSYVVFNRNEEVGAFITDIMGAEKIDENLRYEEEIRDNYLEVENNFIQKARKHYNKIPNIECFSERILKGNILNFKRLSPSLCDICNKTHDNDNTLYILFNPKEGLAFYGCIRKKKQLKLFYKEERQEDILLKDKINTISPLKDIKADKIINEKEIKSKYNFNDKEVLLIKSSTGTGKTKQLLKYIEENQPKRILLLTFRRTLAYEFVNKFNHLNFESYLNKSSKEINKIDRLIIQVESLYKINDYDYDLVVMDEIESIHDQFFSPTNKKHYKSNIYMMEQIIKNSNRIIAMDAYLSNKSIELFKDKTTYIISNQYKSEQENKYFITRESKIIEDKIIKDVRDNKKVVICCNKSKNELYKYYDSFKKEYPEKNIKIYTSETDNHNDLKDVSNQWSDVDILLYTPTITAGVSFELKRFDVCYGIFDPNNGMSKTALQMLKRVRDIESKTYIIYIRKFVCNSQQYITDKAILKEFIKSNEDYRKSLMDEYLLNFDEIKIDLTRYSTFEQETAINNKIEQNKDKIYYFENFISALLQYGADIKALEEKEYYYKVNTDKDNIISDDLETLIIPDKNHESRDIKKNINKIIDARELSDYEAYELKESKKKEDREAITKYFLRKRFNYNKELTPEAVEYMLKPANQIKFKILKYLYYTKPEKMIFNELKNKTLDINTMLHQYKEVQNIFNLFKYDYDYKNLKVNKESEYITKEELLTYDFSNFNKQFESYINTDDFNLKNLNLTLNKFSLNIERKRIRKKEELLYKYYIRFDNDKIKKESDTLSLNI